MKVPRDQFIIFLAGTTNFQMGWFILEIAVLETLYFQNPKLAVFMDTWNPHASMHYVYGLTGLGLWFIVGGILTGWKQIKFLQKGKVVSGRALNVKWDNTYDEPTYHFKFEYTDDNGERQIIQSESRNDGIVVGQTVQIVIGENGKEALVEQELPGGLRLANFINGEPVPLQCVLRVTMLPLLVLATLLLWHPAVAAFVQGVVDAGYPAVIMVPLILQCVWLFKNKRYLVITTINICPGGGQKTDRPG
jgi:hypothetical protein